MKTFSAIIFAIIISMTGAAAFALDLPPLPMPPSNPLEGTITSEWETHGAFYPSPRVKTSKETYILNAGKETEVEVVALRGALPGPTMYIVAAIHGDEVSGWYAANLLKGMEIARGTLYILSPANRRGFENRVRFVFGSVDLNRQFPGKADGNMAERLAYAIYNDIADKRPSLVLDLHEAINNDPNSDFLGSSIIFTSLDKITELFMDMYFATQMDELCSEPYNYFAPGPIGSINNTVTNNLGIPVLTLETYRAYPLERRVMDHLALTGYVLRYMGLID